MSAWSASGVDRMAMYSEGAKVGLRDRSVLRTRNRGYLPCRIDKTTGKQVAIKVIYLEDV